MTSHPHLRAVCSFSTEFLAKRLPRSLSTSRFFCLSNIVSSVADNFRPALQPYGVTERFILIARYTFLNEMCVRRSVTLDGM
jgi:hypothetical protein